MAIRGVLFDLDGTLLDTAPDLRRAANQALSQYGYPLLSRALAYRYSSHGSTGLLRAVLGDNFVRTEVAPLRAALLNAYSEALLIESQCYSGVAELIEHLDQQSIPWGIVTNKPAFLTDPLLVQLPLLSGSKINVSGDTFAQSKPHPEGLIHCAQILGVPCEQILYVGDAQRDIDAATRAGMQSGAALWGYLRDYDQPSSWGANYLFNTPLHLLDWLKK